MENHISWIIELDVKEEKIDKATALMEKMVEAAKANEEGTLHYEWFFNDDKTTCHIYERYENSEAVLTHLQNLNEHFIDDFMGAFEPKKLNVYGDPSDDAREALDGLGAQYFAFSNGFVR